VTTAVYLCFVAGFRFEDQGLRSRASIYTPESEQSCRDSRGTRKTRGGGSHEARGDLCLIL